MKFLLEFVPRLEAQSRQDRAKIGREYFIVLEKSAFLLIDSELLEMSAKTIASS